MRSSVLLIWIGFLTIFMLIPMGLSWTYGPHPVFYQVSSNYLVQIVSAVLFMFGVCVPVFIKMRPFRLRRIFNLTNFAFRFLVFVFIFSHTLIVSEFGLDFRHHIRISSMGGLGYFYALEQLTMIPFTFFILRLVVCDAYKEISKYRGFLMIYALMLVLFPFNFSNLLCGILIIVALYVPKLLTMKLGITSTILLPFVGIIALVGATYLIKGSSFDGVDAVARYLQYRISIWQVSADLLANMPWENRLSLFSQGFFDEASINTLNADVIFSGSFANSRVGAGPGVIGSSLYLLPFPLNLFLVTIFGFMFSYFLKCSGLFNENRSMFLVIAVFCLLFPFLASPIQLASLEVMPVVNVLLLIIFLSVEIPTDHTEYRGEAKVPSSKGESVHG